MSEKSYIKLVECPRDAMQGLHRFIPTSEKINYINQLLRVGFHTLDFGSFVNPKLVPQMADTHLVAQKIDKGNSLTKLLCIVGNLRGAQDALAHELINIVGFPFSISETFQKRNTNAGILESEERIAEINSYCNDKKRELLIYISMGFGNPYGDFYSPDIVYKWVEDLSKLGVKTIAIADTVAMATPVLITQIFDTLIKQFPHIEFGAHFHTAPHNWLEKIQAAYNAGCRRFDTALFGYGGCPMAKDELIGNMPTEHLVNYFAHGEFGAAFNKVQFEESLRMARTVFPA